MKPDYPLPEGMEWLVQETFIGAYSEEDRWWYGWVRTEKNENENYDILTVATENRKPLLKKEHGKFESIDAACKFMSAYLILGDAE